MNISICEKCKSSGSCTGDLLPKISNYNSDGQKGSDGSYWVFDLLYVVYEEVNGVSYTHMPFCFMYFLVKSYFMLELIEVYYI